MGRMHLSHLVARMDADGKGQTARNHLWHAGPGNRAARDRTPFLPPVIMWCSQRARNQGLVSAQLPHSRAQSSVHAAGSAATCCPRDLPAAAPLPTPASSWEALQLRGAQLYLFVGRRPAQL